MKPITPQTKKRVSIFSQNKSKATVIGIEPSWTSTDDLIQWAKSELSLPEGNNYKLALKRNGADIHKLTDIRDEDDLVLIPNNNSSQSIKSKTIKKSITKEEELTTSEEEYYSTASDNSNNNNKKKKNNDSRDTSPSPDGEIIRQKAIVRHKFRQEKKQKNYFSSEHVYIHKPLEIIESYFFGKTLKAHPAKIATFMVLAQNFEPMTRSQIFHEAVIDGYLLKSDAGYDILDDIRDEISRLKSKSFFLTDKNKIGLSEYGQEVVDSITNLKHLISMLSKRLVKHNIVIDTSRYPSDSSSSSHKIQPKKDTESYYKRKRFSLESPSSRESSPEVITTTKKIRHSPPPLPRPSPSATVEEIIDIKPNYLEPQIKPMSSQSSDNSSNEHPSSTTIHNKGVITKQLSEQLRDNAVVSWDPENAVWIAGIPYFWKDNLFVKKKITTAIKKRFEDITVGELRKDTYSNLWVFTATSNSEVKQIIGHTLQIEGNEKVHTLTFLGDTIKSEKD